MTVEYDEGSELDWSASDVVKSKMFLDCVDGRKGRHTKDEELLGWEGGCLSLADLPELASWYGGSHVEL